MNFVDPKGQFPIFAGIVVGAFTGGIVNAAMALLNPGCEGFDPKAIGKAFVTGAIAGGLAGLGGASGFLGAVIGEALGIAAGIAYGPDSSGVNAGDFVKGLQTVKDECNNNGKCK